MKSTSVEPLEMLLISGSIRIPSYTRALTGHVEAILRAAGIETTHWDLTERPLPIADPRFHHDPPSHPDADVRALVSRATAADGFVLATPIYHNSYSGVLKNALDHLAIPQFQYKPVGLLSHGGNRSTQGVDHLRIVTRGLLGVSIPAQVCTAQDDYRLLDAATCELTNVDILARVSRFAAELVLFASHLRVLRQSLTSPAAAAVANTPRRERDRAGRRSSGR
jgi:NAD(P)H-dependent FMN reductase